MVRCIKQSWGASAGTSTALQARTGLVHVCNAEGASAQHAHVCELTCIARQGAAPQEGYRLVVYDLQHLQAARSSVSQHTAPQRTTQLQHCPDRSPTDSCRMKSARLHLA